MKKSRIPLLMLLFFIPLLSVSCVQHAVWTIASGFSQEYKSYGQVVEDLHNLAELRPDIAELHSLGKTYEGRDIWAIRIGIKDPDGETAKPEILAIGCIHSNEWIAKEVILHFAERLVEEEKASEEIRSLLKRANIWLIPVANPDGMVYSEEHNREWRKNRRAFGGDNYGVDPNRAYPYMWRLPGDTPDNPKSEGGRDNPARRTFRGYPDLHDTSKPAEIQNEVLAILSLVSNPDRNFILFLDYHSFCELVLYPPGFSKDPPPDKDAYVELASGIAEKINETRKSSKIFKILQETPISLKYGVGQVGTMYPKVVTGGSIDMMYYVYGIWSLAMELPPAKGKFGRRELLYISGTGYRLPASRILPTCIENWPGFMFACNWALEHGLPKKIQTPAAKPRYTSAEAIHHTTE